MRNGGMIMWEILKKLQKSGRKEKRYLLTSYIINITFIGMMLMFGFGMSNSANLSLNDAEQAEVILSSMIIVAIIVIAFLQWLTAMQFLALFDSRKGFNQNIRLIGLSSGKLCFLYFMEILKMQFFCIPVGLGCAEIIYFFYAMISQAEEKLIPIRFLVIAAVLHLIIVIVVNLLVGGKCADTNLIDWIRGKAESSDRQKIGKIVASTAVGIVILFLSIFLSGLFSKPKYQQAVQLLILVAVPFFYGTVSLMIQWIAERIAATGRRNCFWMALKICAGQRKGVKVIRLLVFYSCVLICGLYGMYTTVRELAFQRADSHILYEGYVWLKEPTADYINDNAYQTLSFSSRLSEDSGIRITGIDSDYSEEYEEIEIAYSLDREDADIISNFNDENFNGILLDTDYIKLTDLGDSVSYQLNGKEISFTVYGGYVSNNMAEFNGYVSRKYLEKQLGLEDSWNRAFFLESEDLNKMSNMLGKTNIYEQKTKAEQCLKSYEHAVQGTGEIELVCWLIMICAMIAAATCICMRQKNNENIIARLNGMGMDKVQIQKIYIEFVVWVIAIAFIPAILFSVLFQKAACGLILSPEILEDAHYVLPIPVSIVVGILFLVVMTGIQLYSIRKMFDRSAFVEYLRKS